MDAIVWFTYVATVLVLMSTPGPSQLLMLSNSISYGLGRSLYTAAGDLTANFLQMIVAFVGLASLVTRSETFFMVVKWAGVAYLVYLGARQVLSSQPLHCGKEAVQRSISSLYWRGFITSAANPKAIIFFAALFPQFINPQNDLLPQFIVLSVTYLTLDGAFLFGYGRFAGWVRGHLSFGSHGVINKICGSLLIGAAVMLGSRDIK